MSLLAFIRSRWNEPQGYAEILRVGMPLVASMASTTLMQFTDRLFLSRYSVEAIAASMPASMASLTVMLTLVGVCGYTSVLIAHYMGSGAPHRVGSALWQGVWSALAGAAVLCLTWWPAEALFKWVGHEPAIQALELTYFRTLNTGAGFSLLGAALSGFFSGRGQTRPIMAANLVAALLNIPLDYLFIFGGLGIPPLGILGAGIATGIGWMVSAVILALYIFTRENDAIYGLKQGLRFENAMFRRLLRYGLPSGVNFFMELVGTAWFSFEVGIFGRDALAASNIAFSLNSLVFLPMIGLNIGLAALVGQAMGRGRPLEAERVTTNTLHLAFAYMLPVAIVIAFFAGPLMDVFTPGDMSPKAFAPVRELGIIMLYFIAVYSLVDACNIVYFGALKGAGDTLGILALFSTGLVFFLILPIIVLKIMRLESILSCWAVFTAYVMLLALAGLMRFRRRRWHSIRVVETVPDLPG